MSWIYRRESTRLLAYERKMAAEFSATVLVSEKEAEFFKALAPESADKIDYRIQGVDSAFFDPNQNYDSPYQTDEKVIIFVGAMDYWPNIDAVKWFAEDIFPGIKDKCDMARFYIVGMNPTEAVQKLESITGVHVTGRVKDIRDYMAYADLAVAPLRIARGIQNKVLEAMAMDLPVVASQQAMTGIHYDADQFQPVVTNEPSEMQQKILEILDTADKTEYKGGRQVVLAHYNWDSSLQKIKRLLGG